MEFRAEMRYLRVSPQKARLVLELIKGRRVEEARNTLAFTKKREFSERREESRCRYRQPVCEECDRQ